MPPVGPALAPETLHRSLTSFFLGLGPNVAELEILPSAYPITSADDSILLDERCLAIRQRDLVAAYTIARQQFFANTKGIIVSPTGLEDQSDACIGTSGDTSQLLNTLVLLLFAPEHQTAANWRKCRLQHCIALLAASDAAAMFHSELRALDSFVTSPLPKHTKSPTLWQHRYWVVSTLASLGVGEFSEAVEPSTTRLPDFTDELRIVLKAADRHFANYVAFDYARRLWALYECSTEPRREERLLQQGNATDMVLGWCRAHPRDISGWNFLAFLLRKQPKGAATNVESKMVAFLEATGCKNRATVWFVRTLDEELLQRHL